MIAMVEHATIGPLKALGVPVKLSETPGAVRTPPPTLGQHTDAVLRARSRIQRRRDRRVAPAAGHLTAMEISLVRKRLTDTIDRAKKQAADRRGRGDQAARDFEVFLQKIAVPLFRQLANALKADGYAFTVFTPSDSVRLMSDRAADDFIELSLDPSADRRGSWDGSAARAAAASSTPSAPSARRTR